MRPISRVTGMRLATPAVSTPFQDAAARPRLNRQCRVLLAAFRAAPGGRMTNAALREVTHRFGARIFDLRAAGCLIEVESHDHATGLVVYRYWGEGTPAARTLTPIERARRRATRALAALGDGDTAEVQRLLVRITEL